MVGVAREPGTQVSGLRSSAASTRSASIASSTKYRANIDEQCRGVGACP